MPDDLMKEMRNVLLKARYPGWGDNPIIWGEFIVYRIADNVFISNINIIMYTYVDVEVAYDLNDSSTVTVIMFYVVFTHARLNTRMHLYIKAN